MTPSTSSLLSAIKGRIPHYLGDTLCYRLYEVFQQLLGYPAAYGTFRRSTGQELHLSDPITCADKITYLKLFDKNPILPIITDKTRVRRWVAERIGEQYLIPLLGVHDSPEEIDLDSLPDRFIIKINFASGRNILVMDKRKLDWKGSKARLASWLNSPQAYHLMEWNHHMIRPRILIEELLLDDRGLIPPDFKCDAFHGEVKCIQRRDVSTGRRFDSYHTPTWEPIPMECSYPQNPVPPPPPENLEEMIRIVRTLASGFAYMRVDLYSVGGRIHFGEMTPHAGSGLFHLQPEEFNKGLGDYLNVSHIRPSWTLLPLR